MEKIAGIGKDSDEQLNPWPCVSNHLPYVMTPAPRNGAGILFFINDKDNDGTDKKSRDKSNLNLLAFFHVYPSV